jgi:hypothetical protein
MKVFKYVAADFVGSSVAGDVFENIKDAVLVQMDVDIPNEEKHAAVFKKIKKAGYSIANWALNVGIKMAVIWIKSKAQ